MTPLPKGIAELPIVREHTRRSVADLVLRLVAMKFGDAARAQVEPWFEQASHDEIRDAALRLLDAQHVSEVV
jgi:hypothetical protein